MKPTFRIALVEDDADQRRLTVDIVNRQLRDRHFELSEIVSEERFRSALGRGELRDYDVVVMDVMLPWTSVDDFVAPPDNYAGYYDGGLRCIRELRLRDWGRTLPVIIYTLLESQDISEDLKKMERVVFVNKAQPKELLKQLEDLARGTAQAALN